MAPVCLTDSHIPHLLKILQEYGEKALIIKNIIQMYTTKYEACKHEVWVDVWPNFTALLVIQDWTTTEVTQFRHFYYEFSLSNESLKKLLQTPELVDCILGGYAGAVTKDRYDVIMELIKSSGISITIDLPFQMFYLPENRLQTRPLPEDLIVGSLTKECSEDVARNWEYANIDTLDSTKKLIEILINTFPNICLYNSVGKAVAYALGTAYGGLGMLYVNPEYRGRGCAKAVMSILSEKYIKAGITPFVWIASENTLSISLHTDLGFQLSENIVNCIETILHDHEIA